MNTRHVILALALAGGLASLSHADDWPRFRGPNGSGYGAAANVPLSWSDTEHVSWKAKLPGPGASSPIVVGDRVLVTCYTGYGTDRDNPGKPSDLQRHLLCFDRHSGTQLWQATVASTHDEDAYQGFITEHGYASSTPVTDGEQVYVMFGKTGVAAFDLDGRQLWLTNVGTESDPARWGNGGSCILFGDLVIVNAANVGHAIIGLNKKDGSEAWKYFDPEMTSCWSTPILVSAAGRQELVNCVPGKILALDPASGKELWVADSPINSTTCASLVEQDGTVFAMGGRAGDAIAVRCGGNGDVSETHTVWKSKLRSGIGTPVVSDGKLFWTATGIAFCARCDNGETVYKERLPGPAPGAQRRRPAGDYASAITLGEKVLLTLRSGAVHVLPMSDTFSVERTNQFADDAGPFHGTPAVSDGQLFIRSDNFLYCIAQP